METSKFIWAYKSLTNKWQEVLSITLCICTAITWHRLDAEVNHNSNAESPKGFKCTRTFWSCHLMPVKVLLYVPASLIPTWQGRKQTHCVRGSEWAPSALAAPWANPPPSPDCCLKLEAFPLKEQGKLPFLSPRNHDRHKWFGGLISDSLLEQLGSVWVGFTANVLQVKQAPVQPLSRGVIASHTPSAVAKQTGKRRKTKHVPATHRGEEQNSRTARFYSFCHSHFTGMWWLSCPWAELIFLNIISVSNQVQLGIPLVMETG